MSTKQKRLWQWAVAALVVAMVAVGAWHKARGPKIQVVVAHRRDMVHNVVASGRVLPSARVNLGSMVMGTVTTVGAEEGQRVRAGQLLIQLDDAEARAAVAQARASVAQAQAKYALVRRVGASVSEESLRQARVSLDQADRNFKRTETLFASGAVSQEQLDDARRALDVARSQVQSAATQASSSGPGGAESQVSAASIAQATAGLTGAEARLAQTRITAPCDGVILTRMVEPGDVVQPGKVLLVVARDGSTRLAVQPDEKNLAFLREGQPAIASADAFPAQRFNAVISQIAPIVDRDRGTVEIKLDVPNPPNYLRTDMTVSVDVEVGRKSSAVGLPVEAVRDLGTDHPWVMMVVGGRSVRRPVQVGIQGDGMVEIAGGVAEGDQIIPASAMVSEGSRVRAEVASAL